MSSGQRRLYAIESSESAGTSYNMPIGLYFNGKLDKVQLDKALSELSEKYELLRTTFTVENNEFIQLVTTKRLVYLESDFKEREIDSEILMADFVRPFNLKTGPLMRVKLVEVENEGSYLMIDLHHIIADGESISLIWKDLSKAYLGENLNPLKLQYKDFSAWENKLVLTKQKQFWHDEFKDESPLLELQTDFPRKNKQTYNGNLLKYTLDKELSESVSHFCQKYEITEFIFFLSVFNILLGRYARQKDVIVGSPFSARTNRQLASMLGMFVNTLPIRTVIDGEQQFVDYLEGLKNKCFSIYENQNYPFESLLEDLNLQRDSSRNPLFDVMFAQESASEAIVLDEMEATILNTEISTAKFDLSLTLVKDEEKYVFGWEYSTDLFKKQTIERMSVHFETLILAVISHPKAPINELNMISVREKKMLVETFNQTEAVYQKDKTIIQLIEEQVQIRPNAVAAVFSEQEYTYAELNARSNHIAWKLKDRGIGPNQIVGIISESSIQTLTAILAVLKAGAAYMPIDPKHPIDRVTYILEKSCAKIVLIGEGGDNLAAEVQTTFPDMAIINVENKSVKLKENLSLTAGPKDLMYVIFTSGSTGTPKGVMVENQSVVNVCTWQITNGEIDSKTKVIQNYNYIFDASVSEIFPTLMAGGTLLMLTEEEKKEPRKYLDLLKEAQLCCVPSMFREILNFAETSDRCNDIISFDKLYLAAEALPLELLEQFMKVTGRDLTNIYNIYGPTETTDSAVFYDFSGIKNPEKIYIGKPIANLKLYVLNDKDLCGINVPGELCIGGAGVTRGYLQQPELTAEKFIENPYASGERIYRTGDLVRWSEDGNIDYLGRIDEQVKIRGFRIELGEIESRLQRVPGIREAVVIVKNINNTKSICAYFISDEEVTEASLNELLSYTLPNYMIPQFFVRMDVFPRTRTGKLDRKSLPEPIIHSDGICVPPDTEAESAVIQVFTEILNIKEKLSVTANFFSLGGDSIKAIRIVSKLREEGYQVTVPDIMGKKTPRKIAEGITKEVAKIIDQAEVSGPVTPIPIQKDFLETESGEKHHFNQSMLLRIPSNLSCELLENAFQKLLIHHDVLRAVYDEGEQVILSVKDTPMVKINPYDFSSLSQAEGEKMLEEVGNELQRSINLKTGPLVKVAMFKLCTSEYLLIVIHHLVIDGVSWRILIEDLKSLCRKDLVNRENLLPDKTDSFKKWSEMICQYSQNFRLQQELPYWKAVEKQLLEGQIRLEPDRVSAKEEQIVVTLTKEKTDQLLKKAGNAYQTEINDLLLAAVAQGVYYVTNQSKLAIQMEGHGREAIDPNIQIDRTIGWFTSVYPIVLDNLGCDISLLIRQTKETIRKLPVNGIGYGILKMLPESELTNIQPDITFNYLGEFHFDDDNENDFSISPLEHGRAISEQDQFHTKLSLDSFVSNGKLQLTLTYKASGFSDSQMSFLLESIVESLDEVITHCIKQEKTIITPSDAGEIEWSLEEFNQVVSYYGQRNCEIDRVFPLTGMQKGMLYHKIFDETDTSYVVQSNYKIQGLSTVNTLKDSLQLLQTKHGILETAITYRDVSEARQVLLKGRPIELSEVDMSEMSESEYKKMLADDVKRGFDLESDSLIRMILVHLADNQKNLVVTFHHIIMDGWCSAVLMNDLNYFYTELTNGKSKEQLRRNISTRYDYEKYVRLVNRKSKADGYDYWKNLLLDYDNYAEIPATISNQQEKEVKVWEVGLNQTKTKAFEQLSKKESLTLNTIVEVAWGLLLQKYTNKSDVVYGKIVSGRNTEVINADTIIGLFINTIPIRMKTEVGNTVLETLKTVQNQAINSSNYDFIHLAEIQSKCTNMGNRLIQSVIAFENYYNQESTEEGALAFNLLNGREETNYPLTLAAFKGDVLKFGFMYKTDKFSETDVQLIARRFIKILEEILEKLEEPIGNINYIDSSEQQLLIQNFNQSNHIFEGEKTIVQKFEEQVRNNPSKTAVIFGEDRVTYEELSQRSQQVATALMNRGVVSKQIVALAVGKSVDMIAGMIGILKTGAAYLPVDLNHPDERIDYMLNNAEASFILLGDSQKLSRNLERKYTVIELGDTRKEEINNRMISISIEPQNTAYVIYTSGTTGRPKGVEISHRNVLNLASWQKENAELTSSTTVLQYFNYIFDGSVWEIFPALLAGSVLEIISEEDRNDPEKLLKHFCGRQLTIVPSLFTALLDYAIEHDRLQEFNSFDKLFLAGESLPSDVVMKYADLSNGKIKDVYNAYGPTETTVCATIHRFDKFSKDQRILIGRPIGNTHCYILNGTELCGIGIQGELCVGGESVSKGYINQKELTKERFVENPYNPNEILYKTGDLAKWTPDGEIECLGRIDEQVKIRGYRIELGEIDRTLRRIDGVIDAVTVVRKINEESIICSYIVGNDLITKDMALIELEKNLPDYMLPTFIETLKAFPKTKTGKIDKNALITPTFEPVSQCREELSETERTIIQVFKEVLNVSNEISSEQSFFDLGGDSLKAIKVVTQLRKVGYDCGIREIMNRKTAKRISQILKENVKTKIETGLAERFKEGIENADLSFKTCREKIISVDQKEICLLFIEGVTESHKKIFYKTAWNQDEQTGLPNYLLDLKTYKNYENVMSKTEFRRAISKDNRKSKPVLTEVDKVSESISLGHNVGNRYELSPIQEYLLTFPYSVIQDEIIIKSWDEELVLSALKQTIQSNGAMRSIKLNGTQIVEYPFEKHREISYFDLRYVSEEKYQNNIEKIKSYESFKQLTENRFLMDLYLVREDDITFKLYLTSHHIVWDKISSLIIEEEIQDLLQGRNSYEQVKLAYSSYAEQANHNQSVVIENKEVSEMVKNYRCLLQRYRDKHLENEIIRSEAAVLNISEDVVGEVETWAIIDEIVHIIASENQLLETDSELPLQFTQEERNILTGDFTRSVGPIIDMLPIFKNDQHTILEQFKSSQKMKERFNLNWLNLFRSSFDTFDKVLLINYLGVYEMDEEEFLDDIHSTNYVKSREITISKCKNQLLVRYPVFRNNKGNTKHMLLKAFQKSK